MRRFRTLLRRELRVWTQTPGSWFLAAAYLAAVGALFCGQALTGAGRGLLTTELTFGHAGFWVAVLALAALCSVRGFREELDSGAIELLLTVPVRETEVVLAKYLALLEWLGLLCLLAAAPPWALRLLNPGWHGLDPVAWSACALHLGLAVAAVAATGLAFSLWLRGAAAAAVTFLAGVVLVFGTGAWIGFGSGVVAGGAGPGAWTGAAGLELFTEGVIDSRWIVLCVSVTGVALFAAVRQVIALRYGRASGGLNVAVSVALAVVLAALANSIAMRHFVRWDRFSGRGAGLSGETLQTLRAVKTPLKMTLVGPADSDRTRAAWRLLERFRTVCPLLTLERVDPRTDLARTRELARSHGFSRTEVLISEGGGRHNVLELGRASQTAPAVAAPMAAGRDPDLETALSSAVYTLTQSLPVLCFLSGHGERSVDDFTDYAGYSELAALLRRSHAAVRTGAMDGGSNDCSVLVVAGPASLLTPRETARIREQVSLGVGVLLLLDAGHETGLEPMLAELGIRVGGDRVVESTVTALPTNGKWHAAPRGEGEVHVMTYGQHPITEGLAGLVSTFYLPRSVEPIRAADEGQNASDTADRPRVTALALTGKSSWADSDLEEHTPLFHEGYDRRGPIPVAVCVEKGAPSAVSLDIKPVRLAVFGDSQFVANRCLTEGNLKLFMNTVQWLLGRERTPAPAARPAGVFDLAMSPTRRWLSVALIAGGVPGVLGVVGLLAAAVRRDRRTVRAARAGEAGSP